MQFLDSLPYAKETANCHRSGQWTQDSFTSKDPVVNDLATALKEAVLSFFLQFHLWADDFAVTLLVLP